MLRNKDFILGLILTASIIAGLMVPAVWPYLVAVNFALAVSVLALSRRK